MYKCVAMLVIAILSQKGGVGKIDLATNLAVAFSDTHTVMFLDADAQGSSQTGRRAGVSGTSTWRYLVRAMPAGGSKETRRLASEYNWFVIDGFAGTSRVSAEAARGCRSGPDTGQAISL